MVFYMDKFQQCGFGTQVLAQSDHKPFKEGMHARLPYSLTQCDTGMLGIFGQRSGFGPKIYGRN